MKSISSIQEKFNDTITTNLKSFESTLSKQIVEVPNKIEASSKWSDIVKASPGPNKRDFVQTMKQALTEMSDYDKEMEIRSRGIVIYRAPESVSPLKELRKSDDYKLMEALLEHLEIDVNEIISVDRLGRFDEERERMGKHRPIKVRLASNKTRDLLLSSLRKLRNADDCLKNLSIRQDLNDFQRRELNEKLSEAYQKNRASTTHYYRVRGNPAQYYIKEFDRRTDDLNNS